MRSAKYGILLAGLLALTACGSASVLREPSRWWQAYTGGSTPPPVVDPAFRYLRVDSRGHTLYLVRGDVDSTVDGPVEVYYSAVGEIVRLREGRIVGTAGLPVDWRSVRQSGVPAWSELLTARSGKRVAGRDYLRVRDVVPGYRFNVRESMVVAEVAAPASAGAVIRGASSLRWFEESNGQSEPSTALAPARFAVDDATLPPRVVYSEQCLSADFCLRLQPWPPEADARAGTAGQSR